MRPFSIVASGPIIFHSASWFRVTGKCSLFSVDTTVHGQVGDIINRKAGVDVPDDTIPFGIRGQARIFFPVDEEVCQN